ncbi:MAG: cytidylate kinase family protein [Candidatus Thermoplasmatota archaeon]|nr:cytidylate kinase family protein [Candidatus Thermoplasmatota archaeon]MCL5730553.1 cytidylate kinase family protein [Candidatus Thermoplasmatota archaeon]
MARIAISGSISSGKSTTGKIVAEKAGYRFISGGQIFRERARSMGMSLEEFEQMAENNPEFDITQNNAVLEILADNDCIVVESRLSAFLSLSKGVESFRVFLDASPEIRIIRFCQREGVSREEAARLIMERENSDHDRFMRYFGVDYRDPRLYNMVLDTTSMTAEQAAGEIYEQFRQWLEHERISGSGQA